MIIKLIFIRRGEEWSQRGAEGKKFGFQEHKNTNTTHQGDTWRGSRDQYNFKYTWLTNGKVKIWQCEDAAVNREAAPGQIHPEHLTCMFWSCTHFYRYVMRHCVHGRTWGRNWWTSSVDRNVCLFPREWSDVLDPNCSVPKQCVIISPNYSTLITRCSQEEDKKFPWVNVHNHSLSFYYSLHFIKGTVQLFQTD